VKRADGRGSGRGPEDAGPKLEMQYAEMAALLEHVPEGIVVLDAEGRPIKWNRAALELHGLSGAEDAGRRLSDLINEYELSYPDGRPMPQAEWPASRVLRGEKLDQYEVHVRCIASDWTRVFSYSGALINGPGGKPLMGVLTLRDITSLRQAQSSIQRDREDLDRAQAVAHTGSWRLDARSGELSFSDESYRMFGIPVGTKLTYESFLGHVHPDDRALVDGKWKAALQGEPYDIEHRIIVGGRVRWVRERAELEFDSGGRIRGGFGTVQDITGRKLARQALQAEKRDLEERVRERTRELEISLGSLELEMSERLKAEEGLRSMTEDLERQVLERTEALAESEKRYRTAFEASVNQLLLIRAVRDANGAVSGWRYMDVNENALRIANLERDNVVGRMAGEAMPEIAAAMATQWADVLATGRHRSHEAAFQGRDYLISVSRMDADTVVSSSVDITDRRRSEEALRKARERNAQQEKLAAIGRLAGGVAHEIRNPLSAMKSAVYYLKLALEKPDPNVADTLALLDREIARSETVISSLLGLAHPGRQARADVDINSCVREALEAGAPADVVVETRLDGTVPKVRADPAQIAVVFGNIIRNAFEAMPGGGRLTVSSHSENGSLSVSFSDNGTGILEEDLQRIFEPLVTTKDGGTGLGLPMAKVLVEGHGGSIAVESEPGKGSTFTVKLPVKKTSGPGE